MCRRSGAGGADAAAGGVDGADDAQVRGVGGVPELRFNGQFMPRTQRIDRSRLRGSNVKTKLACVVVACAALSVFGCGSSPQSLIVGKWEAGQAGAKLTAEFGQDG